MPQTVTHPQRGHLGRAPQLFRPMAYPRIILNIHNFPSTLSVRICFQSDEMAANVRETMLEKLNYPRHNRMLCDVLIVTNDGRTYNVDKVLKNKQEHMIVIWLSNACYALNNIWWLCSCKWQLADTDERYSSNSCWIKYILHADISI